MDFNDIEFIKRQFNSVAKSQRSQINSIIAAITIMENAELQSEEMKAELAYSSCKLLTQNMNLSYLCSDELFLAPKYTLNLKEILEVIITECSRLLEPVKREIQLQIDGEPYVKINEKSLTIVIMNLLQNALLHSLDKSAVKVSLSCDEDFACISFTNLSTLERWTPPEESTGTGISLCMKVAQYNSGRLSYSEEAGTVNAKLYLPIEKTAVLPLCADFSADFADYICERFKPVNLFITEVLHELKRR